MAMKFGVFVNEKDALLFRILLEEQTQYKDDWGMAFRVIESEEFPGKMEGILEGEDGDDPEITLPRWLKENMKGMAIGWIEGRASDHA